MWSLFGVLGKEEMTNSETSWDSKGTERDSRRTSEQISLLESFELRRLPKAKIFISEHNVIVKAMIF